MWYKHHLEGRYAKGHDCIYGCGIDSAVLRESVAECASMNARDMNYPMTSDAEAE